MSSEKISAVFMNRIDNTDDIGVLQRELIILYRIKAENDDDDTKEEMCLKIRYTKRRIADLNGKNGEHKRA